MSQHRRRLGWSIVLALAIAPSAIVVHASYLLAPALFVLLFAHQGLKLSGFMLSLASIVITWVLILGMWSLVSFCLKRTQRNKQSP